MLRKEKKDQFKNIRLLNLILFNDASTNLSSRYNNNWIITVEYVDIVKVCFEPTCHMTWAEKGQFVLANNPEARGGA